MYSTKKAFLQNFSTSHREWQLSDVNRYLLVWIKNIIIETDISKLGIRFSRDISFIMQRYLNFDATPLIITTSTSAKRNIPLFSIQTLV